jgi:hypothetical protein
MVRMSRLLLFLAAMACAQTTAPLPAWLAGTWTGTVDGASAEESWTRPRAGAMLATSRTISGEKMVLFEYLRIVARADGVYYIAQPNGRPPTEFRMTKSTATSMVFENHTNEFPKVITYRLESPVSLVATISDGKEKKQEFRFRRE